MSDIADKANEVTEAWLQQKIDAARGVIKPGKEGDCDMCGEWFGRLIKRSLCAMQRQIQPSVKQKAMRQAKAIKNSGNKTRSIKTLFKHLRGILA